MMQFYCPKCFAEIGKDDRFCPRCGANIAAALAEGDYFSRLIHALNHPVDQTRMGAIIALGALHDDRAAGPLADLAFSWPVDIWQSLEIIRSLRQLEWTKSTKEALQRLHEQHPSALVQRVAEGAIHAFEVTGKPAPEREVNLAKFMKDHPWAARR